MADRDEFTELVKRRLAQRAGGKCSKCNNSTMAPARGHDGVINNGKAAHITAAAVGGPRYDDKLTAQQRRAQSNGIHLCGRCHDLVDADPATYRKDMLKKWKTDREAATEIEFFSGHAPLPDFRVELTEDIQRLLEAFGLKDANIDELTSRVRAAAIEDSAKYRALDLWPAYAAPLSLIMEGAPAPGVTFAGCAAAVRAFGGMTIVAPPGSGKSTTGVQLVDAILADNTRVAAMIPLNQWGEGTFFNWLTQLASFRHLHQKDFLFLAIHDRLTLVLDGWNELNNTRREAAISEIERIRRDTPMLQFVLTSRRPAQSGLIDGRVLMVNPLSEDQQMEIARATAGPRGERLVDTAWRNRGMRELIASPLHLNTLLRAAEGDAAPATKEGFLHLLVRQYGEKPRNAAALAARLHGFHDEYLADLSVALMRVGTTSLASAEARALITACGRRLQADGQISQVPEPVAVLDLLVDHHALVKSADGASVGFVHQQLQEWYASRHVEVQFRAAANGDANARRELWENILDIPAWEEAILFACERVSRVDAAGAGAVAASILDALRIDPILSAEMIHRSADGIWPIVGRQVMDFVQQWHPKDQPDRALRFMIQSGRSEFADMAWRLFTNDDGQVQLRSLRAARPLRIGVMGNNVLDRLAQCSERVRMHLAAELGFFGDAAGMELAASIAMQDPSPDLQERVIDALEFRQSERLVRQVLAAAHEETWIRVANRGHVVSVNDPALNARLGAARTTAVRSAPGPIERINILLSGAPDPPAAVEIRALVASPEFVHSGPDSSWALSRAYERFPKEVAAALIERLEAGLKMPSGGAEKLRNEPPVDSGRVADLILGEAPMDLRRDAIPLAGEEIVGALMDRLISAECSGKDRGSRSAEESERLQQMEDLIDLARRDAVAAAVRARAAHNDPPAIAVICGMLSHHGRGPTGESAQLDSEARSALAIVLARWVDVLLADPASTRRQLAHLGAAIGWLANENLVHGLQKLLDADLDRWRRARAERAAKEPGYLDNDAQWSWTRWYANAFSAVGGGDVVKLIASYLIDPDFGEEAASVLLQTYSRREALEPTDRLFGRRIDFSRVPLLRNLRRASAPPKTSVEADLILAAACTLLAPERSAADKLRATTIGEYGLLMPHAEKLKYAKALLAAPVRAIHKRGLMKSLVLTGEEVEGDALLAGIKDWLALAEKETWRLQKPGSELEEWVALLVFSDRPRASLDALDILHNAKIDTRRYSLFMSALGHAGGADGEFVLAELVRRNPALINDEEWQMALAGQNSGRGLQMWLDLACSPEVQKAQLDGVRWRRWATAGDVLWVHAHLRADFCRRLDDARYAPAHEFLESALAESPDSPSLLKLLARSGNGSRRYRDLLYEAIRHQVIGRRPVDGASSGVFETFSVSAADVRRDLYAVATSDKPEAALAAWCLELIDNIRDSHGRLAFEPRHPHLAKGGPWPIVPPPGGEAAPADE